MSESVISDFEGNQLICSNCDRKQDYLDHNGLFSVCYKKIVLAYINNIFDLLD